MEPENVSDILFYEIKDSDDRECILFWPDVSAIVIDHFESWSYVCLNRSGNDRRYKWKGENHKKEAKKQYKEWVTQWKQARLLVAGLQSETLLSSRDTNKGW